MTTTSDYQLWILILTALISGLAGALISTWVHIWREQRMFKVHTIKKYAANRYDIKGAQFTEALNEIFVVFNDCKEVMVVLGDFHRIVDTRQGTEAANDGLIRLYKAMCKDVHIRYDHFNDSFFLKPFNLKE